VSKAKQQRRHARRRAKQRLGIDLGPKRMRALISDIQNNRLTFHSRQSHRVTRWITEIDSKKVFVIYDSKRKTVVSLWNYDETRPPKG
jgi:hypothetical protein